MSSYSGGVSITQVSAFNSNPDTMKRVRVPNIRAFGQSTAQDLDDSLASFFANAKGPSGTQIVPPANISGGLDLINTTGKGFIGCIYLPKFVASGNCSISIVIDGVSKSYTLTGGAGGTAFRGLFLPVGNGSAGSLVDFCIGEGSYAPATNDWPTLSTTRIKSIGDYIAEKAAIRFETSVRVSISSAVATDATSKTLVQCLKDGE